MSETTPNNNGGYDYEFVEPPENRYTCNICHLPSRDPYMTGKCCRGQIFCKSCLDKALSISTNCPICRVEKVATFPNFQLEREIKNLNIYCTNKKKGCSWRGEISDIDHHLSKTEQRL